MNQPSFAVEQQYWDQGITPIAGLDEAGMGALAGPVVAAAVVFPIAPSGDEGEGIRDSKQLTAKQREKSAQWIKANTDWGIGEASIDEITAINIRRAAHLAMRRAIEQLKQMPALLLLDGNPADIHSTIPTHNIIKGDSISLSIAAASILAKTHRDAIMKEIDEQYPGYKFAQHKGYASPQHKAALEQLGPSLAHRPTYAPIRTLLTKAAAIK